MKFNKRKKDKTVLIEKPHRGVHFLSLAVTNEQAA
jgi:hypothetical protein